MEGGSASPPPQFRRLLEERLAAAAAGGEVRAISVGRHGTRSRDENDAAAAARP